ncbi:BT_3987 domain-containing protein [Salinibacter ruber]|jgi:hypothetical protein|uniref:BT_3987 domain-containing protein n=1 Tax=Salinibacter ruber TaxID=146919 RepID=UPI002073EC6F|nr:hypothetical protein [Salinibacter ruber]MCS3637478.1 hypothetical protein [Salinibacter ruber]MCS3701195.1 hypothetical protein [Salinibacter ruber]MCS4146765.1 hypothetical protein [Salinibacter ruber]
MKIKYTVLALGAIALLLTGCDLFEQRNRTFDDDPRIEFFPTSATVSESDLDASGSEAASVEIEVQLIGPQRNSELPVSFSALTPADTSLSGPNAEVAEEGVHYNIPSTSSTIPAGSSQTTVSVDVLNNSLDDGGTNYILFLNLQDSEGVAAAENLSTYRLTIRGSDE